MICAACLLDIRRLPQLKARGGQKVVLRIGYEKHLWAGKLELSRPETNASKEANIMATYNRVRLGSVVKAGSNYGFDIVDEQNNPLVSIAYPTEAEAKAARAAIETALAKAVALGTR
jgi:hypothetical protein